MMMDSIPENSQHLEDNIVDIQRAIMIWFRPKKVTDTSDDLVCAKNICVDVV